MVLLSLSATRAAAHRSPLAALFVTLAFAACASNDSRKPVASPQQGFEEPSLEPRVDDLEERTLRVVLELGELPRSDILAIEAWIFEALAQSSWLDIAPREDGLGDGRDSIVVRASIERDGLSVFTTSLVRRDRAPLALAGIRDVRWNELPRSLDRLALETRRTLGEPITSLARDARPARALVSADPRVAGACARARQLLANRRLGLADAALKQALARDPNCALALSLAAGTRLDLGRSPSAVDFAKRALALEDRLSPAAAQRAARVVLLAEGANARGLLELASKTLEQRPHDAGAKFTRGLALALDGQYRRARPVLEELTERYPVSPGLLFSLAHTRLATGDLEGARALLAAVERRVPPMPAARLRAFVLVASGDDKALVEHFAKLERSPEFRSSPAQLTLLTMRASHAILRGRDPEAIDACLQILDRLRAAPKMLRANPAFVSELVWTLARLGRADAATRALAQLRGPKGFPPSIRGEMAFSAGLLTLASAKRIDEARIRNIEELGNRAGARRLEGLAYRARGKVERALLSFREAAKGSSDPTLVLEIAESEALAGRVEKSDKLERDLIRELTRPRLDAPREHPLLRPSYAFALRQARK